MTQTKLGFGGTLSTHSFDQFGEMQSDASDNLWNHTNMANLRDKRMSFYMTFQTDVE